AKRPSPHRRRGMPRTCSPPYPGRAPTPPALKGHRSARCASWPSIREPRSEHVLERGLPPLLRAAAPTIGPRSDGREGSALLLERAAVVVTEVAGVLLRTRHEHDA